VATGLPVVLLILPLGGVSAGDIVMVHVTVLAQILFVGAASVACAALAKKRVPVLVLVSATLFLVFAGPGLVRLRWPAAAALCDGVDSWTTLGLLEEQLGGPLPQPRLAGKAVLVALLSAAAGCGTGSLFLDLVVHRGHRPGSLVLSRIIKRLARRPRVEWLFRSHHWSDHPLLEHDLRTTRSLGSALFWAALMVGYGLLAREMLSGTGLREWAEHLEVPALGLTLAGAVAILQGAFAVGARRRSGSLELILSIGVAPEDLTRSLLVLMVRRSLLLSALPALHLILVEIDLFGPWALLWRIPAVAAAVLLSSTVMAGIVLWFSFSIARMELAAFVALLVALPTGVLLFASLTTTLASAAVTLPLVAGALLSGYARLIRRVPKGVLP